MARLSQEVVKGLGRGVSLFRSGEGISAGVRTAVRNAPKLIGSRGLGSIAAKLPITANTARSVVKTSQSIRVGRVLGKPSTKMPGIATKAFIGTGIAVGLGVSARKTLIDINKSLGNPVGFSTNASVRRTFDTSRQNSSNFNNANATGDLPLKMNRR
jgi:hypothetical protein